MDLTVEHEDAAFLIATGQNIVVIRWTGPPSAQAIRLFAATNRRMQKQFPDGAAMVNLVLGGTPKFDGAFIDEAVSAMGEVKNFRTATAHVIPSNGFAGVAVRSVLSTINLMGRPDRPVEVFDDVMTAAKWLTDVLDRHPSRSWTQEELEDALGDICVRRPPD